MNSKVLIQINSLNISLIDFETIVWNQTQIDEIKKREYLTANLFNEDVPLQLIDYLNHHMDPVFVINRWTTDIYHEKKAFDTAIFWLKIFLNDNITAIFPLMQENEDFLNKVRKSSPAVYSKLIKTLQNF